METAYNTRYDNDAPGSDCVRAFSDTSPGGEGLLLASVRRAEASAMKLAFAEEAI